MDPSWRKLESNETIKEDENERKQSMKDRYTVARHSSPESPITPLQPAVKTSSRVPKAEPVRPPPEPVRLDGPPASNEIRATKSLSALPKMVDSEDEEEETAGCFSLFKRKRNEPVPYAQEKSPALRPKPSKASMLKTKPSRELRTIRPGGGGVVPGTDAPMSASNAGDRQVMVVCGKSKAMFPVKQTTTPVDIMKAASKHMRQQIDVSSALLLEDFVTVGVQRPLRRYERIRDIMNSWDSDSQNSLILIDPGTGTSEAELSVSGAPAEKPGDESWYLDFSQKVGKWDKRMITLRADGQVTAQKDLKVEQTNLCHLSDFDIYRPTQEKVKKKIKPPKKYCFAIKSQQKTAMFESTHDFVHFFCTNDRPTADAFYSAVQGWRSWYLVNVMGEGRRPRQTKGALENALKELGINDENVKPSRRGEVVEAHYHVVPPKPLLDVDRSEKTSAITRTREVPSTGFTRSSNQLDPTVSPERRTSIRRQPQRPPGAMSNRAQLAEDEPLGNLGRKDSVNRKRPSLEQKRSESDEFAAPGLLGRSYSQRQKEPGLGRQSSVNRRRPSLDRAGSNPEEFADTGLLGRSYSQRRKDYNEREDKRENGTTSGSNFLSPDLVEPPNNTSPPKSSEGIVRRHSTRAHHARTNSAEGGIQRSNSNTQRKRQMPEPLVDLTPQYREPPQHTKIGRGKGYVPKEVGEGGLIDNATSPEDVLGLPPTNDWRAGRDRQANSGVNVNPSTVSRNAVNARSTKRPTTSRETSDAFTGDGLLAGTQAQQGWGRGTQGRGVMDGSKAKGPMVDMSTESVFAHGSLVAKVESEQGVAAPVIDRTRDKD